MRIDIMTLFPEMCEAVLDSSILGRARRAGLFEVRCHNIRDYSQEKHQKVDDAPYGGGSGMILRADPIFRCFEHVCGELCSKPHTIFLSPKGTVLTQQKAIEFSEKYDNLLLLCGHYEGVDERVLEEIVDEEISLGDFVITGGELAALVLTDAVARLCDGVLSEDTCFEEESHYAGLLEYPQYTRPQEWHNKEVPRELLSGNHEEIAAWRHRKSLEITAERRPDLLGDTHKK